MEQWAERAYNSDEDEKVVQTELLNDEASHKEAETTLLASPSKSTLTHTDRSSTKTTAIVYCAMLTRFSNGP